MENEIVIDCLLFERNSVFDNKPRRRKEGNSRRSLSALYNCENHFNNLKFYLFFICNSYLPFLINICPCLVMFVANFLFHCSFFIPADFEGASEQKAVNEREAQRTAIRVRSVSEGRCAYMCLHTRINVK